MEKRKIKIGIILIFGIVLFLYYQMEYKRYFVSNREGHEYITIWTSSGNDCYIIPGRYYSPFVPKTNFIKTVNHRNYIGIVWETKDLTKFKISLYNEFTVHKLDSLVKVYENNNSLLSQYNVLKVLKNGKILKNDSADYIKNSINYEYVDLNRIWGIKRFRW